MAEVFIGRQPVLDVNQSVWGYELLFRSSTDNRADFKDANQATSQVIVNALLEFGLDRVVGDGFALVNLPRDFLLADHTDILPPGKVVLEVLEDVAIDDELVASIGRIRAEGYTIALDDFAFEPRWAPLLELADIIKVEVPALADTDQKTLAGRVATLRDRGIVLLAEKVETLEEFERYRDLGFSYFQGYFFSRPNVIQGSRIPGNRVQILRLLGALNAEDIQIAELERQIAANVDISYKVMRLLNSSRFSLPREITSIREAITLLGLQQLRRLATMVALSGVDDKPDELVTMSLVRARLCERLAELDRRASPGSAFTVGMMSILDALLDRPLEEVLVELPLGPEVRQALLEGEGALGDYLRWAKGCETGDWAVMDSMGSGAADGTLARLYVEALDWARETMSELHN